MRSRRPTLCVTAFVSLVLLTEQSVLAQGRRGGGPGTSVTPGLAQVDRRDADPLAGPVVTGAPFSADATTTVTQTLSDGTRIEQTSTTKFYRDGTGRVRREQTIIGLDTLNPSAAPRTVITLDSFPGDPMPYVLDPVARTARQMPRGIALSNANAWLNGSVLRVRTFGAAAASDPTDLVLNVQGLNVARRGVPIDLRPMEEQLGTRQIEGVKATGQRSTTTIPQGRIGNDRPIQIVDERWDSPELGLLIASRYSDPRSGVVEYKLTNINRTEPRADLFTVPSDYTVTPFPAVPGGGRGGGRNQGGAIPPATRPPQ